MKRLLFFVSTAIILVACNTEAETIIPNLPSDITMLIGDENQEIDDLAFVGALHSMGAKKIEQLAIVDGVWDNCNNLYGGYYALFPGLYGITFNEDGSCFAMMHHYPRPSLERAPYYTISSVWEYDYDSNIITTKMLHEETMLAAEVIYFSENLAVLKGQLFVNDILPRDDLCFIYKLELSLEERAKMEDVHSNPDNRSTEVRYN